jgi:hypothetical protein
MRCQECGYDWQGDGPDDLIAAAGSFGRRYRAPLTRVLPGADPEVVLRTRPEPAVWSALEYTVHVIEVFGFYAERIRRAVTEDRPQFEGYGFADAADRDRYNERDIGEAAATLAASADGFAEQLAALQPGDWERVGIGSEGDERTVLELGRRAVHDAAHHLLDIGRVLRRVRGR